MKCRFVLICAAMLVAVSAAAQKKERNEYAAALYFGAARQLYRSSPNQTNEGDKISYESDFVKATGISITRHFAGRNALMLDISYAYDYAVGLFVSSSSSGLSINRHSATELYSLWSATVSYQRTIAEIRRITLNAFAGAGLELFTGNYYYKEEQKDSSGNPYQSLVYYHLPSEVNKRPILLLTAGIECGYRTKWGDLIFVRLSGKYAFKTFVTDKLRIRARSSSSQVVTTEMTGTMIGMFAGYKHLFK